MHYSAIFDELLLEQKIQEVKVLALTLNENEMNSSFHDKYPAHVFAPIKEYLNESFLSGIIKKGVNFVNDFTKNAKEISVKLSDAISEFSYKKVFMTVTKMMHKIKTKMLKTLMVLFEPLREVIISNEFCDEDNKFSVGATLRKLISIAKEVGKDAGADALLSVPVVAAMRNHINMEGTSALTEGEQIETARGRATFDKDDVKYMQFFQKIMFKLGVRDTKLNGFLSEITKRAAQGAAIAGIVSIVSSFVPSMGIISAIAGAAGAAVAAAPLLVMIIGAILFGIGLFMFVTWLIKPYPTLENCRIFLGTIFNGADPFSFPEETLATVADHVVPLAQAKRISNKPAFNVPLINDLKDEGVEKNIPKVSKKTSDAANKKLIKLYDDLDIDTLEHEETVKENRRLAVMFVRNIFKSDGHDTVMDEIDSIKEDDEENDFTDALEDLTVLIHRIKTSHLEKEMDDDGKKKYPFALNYRNVREFLKNKENSPLARISKVIDCVDDFIVKVEKSQGIPTKKAGTASTKKATAPKKTIA